MKKVNFISLEESDKDLIISFAIDIGDHGIYSLILLRTLFYEEYLPENERGVKVSLEGDSYDEEDLNVLSSISISGSEIKIKSSYREYVLDISKIEKSDIKEMLKLLYKQNHDNRFTIHVA